MRTGNDITDVNGNPVYVTAAGRATPTLSVHRVGFYRAAYVQDTWRRRARSRSTTAIRYDRYRQAQNLGQPVVDKERTFRPGSISRTALT